MVTGPVGIRCRKCAQVNSSPLFKPQPTGLIRAGAGGLISAFVLGVVLNFIPILGPFIGNVVGAEAVTIMGNQRAIERIPMYRHVECLLKMHTKAEKPEPTRYKMAG